MNIKTASRPHFELIFVPKHQGNVVFRLEQKLKSQGELREEVHALLSKHGITPTKVYISKVDEGKGKGKNLSDMFEGFTWKKYWGKVRGVKSGWFRDVTWKTDFYIHVLYGDKKDGIMFTTEGNQDFDAKAVGQGIYERLLETMQKHGPIPFNQITRVGTIQ